MEGQSDPAVPVLLYILMFNNADLSLPGREAGRVQLSEPSQRTLVCGLDRRERRDQHSCTPVGGRN